MAFASIIAARRSDHTFIWCHWIPGLSETFIMMDDDFFLTEPWTLRDFITPDGGQTLTGDGAGAGSAKVFGSRYWLWTI
jgi:hypothetical protein